MFISFYRANREKNSRLWSMPFGNCERAQRVLEQHDMHLQRNGVSMPVKHQSSGRLLAAVLIMCVVLGCGLPFSGTTSPTPPPEVAITLPPTWLPVEPTLTVTETPTTIAAP